MTRLEERELVQCPRCRLNVRYLVPAYWKTAEHPGFCAVCCQEAAIKFDREGSWPEGWPEST